MSTTFSRQSTDNSVDFERVTIERRDLRADDI
jgi:hypothetical protein